MRSTSGGGAQQGRRAGGQGGERRWACDRSSQVGDVQRFVGDFEDLSSLRTVEARRDFTATRLLKRQIRAGAEDAGAAQTRTAREPGGRQRLPPRRRGAGGTRVSARPPPAGRTPRTTRTRLSSVSCLASGREWGRRRRNGPDRRAYAGNEYSTLPCKTVARERREYIARATVYSHRCRAPAGAPSKPGRAPGVSGEVLVRAVMCAGARRPSEGGKETVGPCGEGPDMSTRVHEISARPDLRHAPNTAAAVEPPHRGRHRTHWQPQHVQHGRWRHTFAASASTFRSGSVAR